MRGRARHDSVNQARLMTLAKHDRVAANPLGLRMLGEVTHDGVESAWEVNVVAVDESDNVAGGTCESLVDRVHLSTIFFAFPVGELVFVAADDRNTLVSAGTVDDDVLERLVTLIQHREDRLFQEPSLVE